MGQTERPKDRDDYRYYPVALLISDLISVDLRDRIIQERRRVDIVCARIRVQRAVVTPVCASTWSTVLERARMWQVPVAKDPVDV